MIKRHNREGDLEEVILAYMSMSQTHDTHQKTSEAEIVAPAYGVTNSDSAPTPTHAGA